MPSLSTLWDGSAVYDTVTLPETAMAGAVGDPSLPVKGAYLLLPPHTMVTAITVSGTPLSLGSGYHLAPVEQPIPLTEDPVAGPLVPNPLTYATDAFLPASLHDQVGVQMFRGFSLLVLALSPVQYNPVSGELLAYPTLTVTVTLTDDQTSPSLYRGLPEDFAAIRERIDNPATLATYHPTALPVSGKMLILTTDALKAGFQPLAEAHNATGVTTIIKTLTDVGGSTTEQIRAYIRGQYNTSGICYVLLGGDDGTIPARILWVEGMDENVTHYEDYMPADHYYGCLDGPYNYDGDGKWGEPTDGTNGGDVDLLADVYVGRACADSLTEVQYFVAKTIAYMGSVNDTYRQNATFAGEYLGDYGIASYGSSYLEQLINGSTADGYTTVGIPASDYIIDRLYDENYGGSWPASQMIARINRGVHFINHLGHASETYNMKMSNSNVQSLTNTKYCFVYSQGCMSGWFDGGDCIAEYFTAKTSHGAVAGIWNARYGFFWSYSTDGDSQRLHRQFWDAVFGEGRPTLGAANHDCKEDNIFIIGRSMIRWCYYETNLFGDPALNVLGIETNQAPYVPDNPSPSNGAVNQSTTSQLSWTAGDPDGDPVTFDVYFGTTPEPPRVAGNQSQTSFTPGPLAYETQYFWQVVAWDDKGASSAGPVWTFTTGSLPLHRLFLVGLITDPSEDNTTIAFNARLLLCHDKDASSFRFLSSGEQLLVLKETLQGRFGNIFVLGSCDGAVVG